MRGAATVDCPAGQFDIHAFDGNTAENGVAFTLIVPERQYGARPSVPFDGRPPFR